ncbi:OadG family protein [Marichromatium gracile]|uniref:Probable oxaloacetate decarboxylase gamma chain n=1 Tax=Marichromatium gracile TaxID=1048 RepID=A0ABR5VGL7_MARGR|nr:OadG family protein [Marichromatium gracile]KXX64839.1 hypothetical protein AY586_01805 [Marichromatium gracile]
MTEISFSELFLEGLQLMGVGMTIVVAFLILLIGVLHLVAAAVRRWAPEETAPEARPAFPQGAGAVTDRRLTAAITAAVVQYRKRRRT